ncbi:tail assembly chaperone [Erwinia phage vB_EamM_Caitlin]|uniref:tail assembly chaperone n=1 Tax=Erwinia phage vB_EamM_Caitlin TaxID=1883379 RepID=UPI00081CE3FD|nr:tail assembly chaperone [Erwinia phage vB_EamM_Caitlin]ANZ48461.1 putative tail assembly-like protein [Erwinia phage vB_EamM_Caitlin]
MNELKYNVLDKQWFILTEDFRVPFTLRALYRDHPGLDDMVYRSGIHPDKLMYAIVPAGFVTDLASIPSALQPILHPDGPWAAAACIHDLLYQKAPSPVPYPDTPAGNLSRAADKAFADLMFLRIMEMMKVEPFLCKSFYEAVKNFGWPSYVDKNADPHQYSYPSVVDVTLNYNRNYLFFREQIEYAIPEHERFDFRFKTCVNARYQNVKRAFNALEEFWQPQPLSQPITQVPMLKV